jgi:hypothetical protein
MSITVKEAHEMAARAASKGIRMTFITAKPRKQPRAGDRRVTKKHGEQVRVFRIVRNFRGEPIGYDCTGGRQRYEWVSLDDPRAALYVKKGQKQ